MRLPCTCGSASDDTGRATGRSRMPMADGSASTVAANEGRARRWLAACMPTATASMVAVAKAKVLRCAGLVWPGIAAAELIASLKIVRCLRFLLPHRSVRVLKMEESWLGRNDQELLI